MISTLTLSLRFTGVDQLLAEQAEACTPTKTLNGSQTAITSGTFEQQFNVPRHSVAGNLSVKSSFDSPQDSRRSRKSRHGVSSNIGD